MADRVYPRYSERFFQVSPLYSDAGWYFRVRGGRSLGPFYEKKAALQAARQYASDCLQRGDSGGRH